MLELLQMVACVVAPNSAAYSVEYPERQQIAAARDVFAYELHRCLVPEGRPRSACQKFAALVAVSKQITKNYLQSW